MTKHKLLKVFMPLCIMISCVVGMSTTAYAEEVTDELTVNDTSATNTEYKDWNSVQKPSGAVYKGNSAKDYEAIQLRGSSNSGIVTTTSGGKAKKIKVKWNSNTASGRILQIYGKNTAYSSAADLYDSSESGDPLAWMYYDTDTEFTIEGDYEYIGIKSEKKALYIDSITITWDTDGTGPALIKADISDASVILDYENKVDHLLLDETLISNLSGFEIKYGEDLESASDTFPTASGTYYAFVTAKDNNSKYEGMAVSDPFTVSGSSRSGGSWVEKDPSALKSEDIVVIYDATSGMAMRNDSKYAVSVDLDEASAETLDDLTWRVIVDEHGYYRFEEYDRDTSGYYLYCEDGNDGVRVGTDVDNYREFTIEGNYLYNIARGRYLGVFNNGQYGYDWRCYTTINQNIKNTVTKFYVQQLGMTLTPDTAELKVGEAKKLTASIVPDSLDDQTVIWSVGGTDAEAVKLYTDADCNTEVGAAATDTLTVYAKGLSAGTATVTCTANVDSNISVSCELNVAQSPCTLEGASVTLNGKFTLNTSFILPEGASPAEYKAVVTMKGTSTEYDLPAEATDGMYTISHDIRAVDSAEPVSIQLKRGDDIVPLNDPEETPYTDGTCTTSILDYCHAVLEEYEDDPDTLAAYTYAAYAAKWYNSDTVLPDDINDISYTLGSKYYAFDAYKMSKRGVTSDITGLGLTLVLDSDTELRLYFKSTGTATAKVDGEPVDVRPSDNGFSYVSIPNISVENLTKKYSVILNDYYSIEVYPVTYVRNTFYWNSNGRPQPDDLMNVVAALYQYADYFKKDQ